MTSSTEEEGRTLRDKAARRLSTSRQDVADMTPEAVQELVYDLQVHQIELEMQNEALVQAQMETELARQNYRDLYDHAPTGYLTIDHDDVIREANLMAATLLGLPRERLIGRKFSPFITQESQDTFFLHKRAVRATRDRQSCQVEVLSAEPMFLHMVSQLSESDQGSFHTVMTDVTLMKKLEARLMEMHQAAEAANIAKSQFLANMSHEIRTPLNVIIGIGHLLGNAQLDAKSNELLAVMRTSAEGLRTLVNELLDFAKIESGKLELEAEPFDLRIVLNDVMRMMELTASQKRLTLDLDYDPALPATFIGDAHRLRQVVLNLVSNAIKFTQAGSVRLRATGVASAGDTRGVDIEVADTGIGISQEKLNTVFDKFTQADPSTTRQFGGTGLGLTIARRLVEQMGGDIAAYSEVGSGSTFRIHLPLKVAFPVPEAASHAEAPAAIAQTSAAKPRILIVEDYIPNVVVMTAYLEGLGYACDVCTDGLQALQQFDKADYVLIFMDVQMPVMDGLQAAAEIRRREQEAGLQRRPIVAISAHVLPSDRQQCLDAGMDAYVPKPFRPDDLQIQLSRFAAPQGAHVG